MLGTSWAAPRPDKTPAALYGAPAPRDCPLQRVEVATGYGCEESQDCTTEYEEKCSTQYEQQCETLYSEQCSTAYESECVTVEDEKCETGYESQCSTVYDDKCETVYDDKVIYRLYNRTGQVFQGRGF